MTVPKILKRQIFSTSRLAEFCSERELTNQTGHVPAEWPLVILKELGDNAIDACEEADIAPMIVIAVSDDAISIADNGPGIAPETVISVLDFDRRVSSREAYASPTRGAQGNALKTIIALPFVLGGGAPSETLITSQGVQHRIIFGVDPVRQIPRIEYHSEARNVKIGTSVTVGWPDSARSILEGAQAQFLHLVESFALLNPHAAISMSWRIGDDPPIKRHWPAIDPTFRKWVPSDPTSPHWYTDERFARLIANHVAAADDHGELCVGVREFIGQFRGLSGSVKPREICEHVGIAKGALLSDLCGDMTLIGRLRRAMCANSAPVRPRDLGVIGRSVCSRSSRRGASIQTHSVTSGSKPRTRTMAPLCCSRSPSAISQIWTAIIVSRSPKSSTICSTMITVANL